MSRVKVPQDVMQEAWRSSTGHVDVPKAAEAWARQVMRRTDRATELHVTAEFILSLCQPKPEWRCEKDVNGNSRWMMMDRGRRTAELVLVFRDDAPRWFLIGDESTYATLADAKRAAEAWLGTGGA